MKVLILKQLCTTLVVEGIKKYEFRSWESNHSDKVLIHVCAGVDKK